MQMGLKNLVGGLKKTQHHCWEQNVINQFGLQKNGRQLLNKINSIRLVWLELLRIK